MRQPRKSGSSSERPIFFRTPSDFRDWLTTHHADQSEQWIGFYRKHTGKPSITWPESVDEALCFGWIDGRRKSIDDRSYKIRFSPRRPNSTWSAINIRRMKELIGLERVHPAGKAAFARRSPAKSGIYAYENRGLAKLDPAAQRQFRANRRAWEWFNAQPPAYRQTVIWWVVSAKRSETRLKRLGLLIANSAAGQRIGLLKRPVAS